MEYYTYGAMIGLLIVIAWRLGQIVTLMGG